MKLQGQVADHPWFAVGSAFALGALFGAVRGGILGRAIAATARVFAIAAIREAAKGYAKHWTDQSERAAKTSYEPEVETFFEH